ncbi:hypothetical protein M9Y10_025359 [Tritrichomonas musculus]|uniref:Uncharacterized protein n=1 Tax=Tritrichomonas musculus TaxID=1915356 RepID=A0ABR2HB75_9EUKA
MEIELNIRQKKEFYSSLMEFIDTNENVELEPLIKDYEKQKNCKNKEEIISTLQLISKIADNHHRLPYFWTKIGKIIQYLIQEIRSQITDFEIYNIFQNTKYVLLSLLEQGIISPDQKIISDIMTRNDANKFPYRHYLYAGIKSFINENDSKMIESEIKQKYNMDINNFEEKCRTGENDSYICTLIRQDLVEEFISYANRSNASLSILCGLM